jgi:endonuclease YncB( thermonuclease family)
MISFRRWLIGALVLWAPLHVAVASAGGEYLGTVNHVLDAETLRIAYKGGQIRVRLADAARAGDDAAAREALSQHLLGRQVRVEEVRWQDGYLIGRVFVDGKNVCSELLSESEPAEFSAPREPGAVSRDL